MNKETGSATAVGAAMLRAAHQLIDGERKLLDDPIILKLLGPEIPGYIRLHRDRFYQPEAIAMRSHIVLRSRYTEDCLKQARERGVRQLIMLGAGMDTFPYRQPVWAQDMKIIEADHPASQASKLKSLLEAAIPVPENLSFVEVDLEADDLRAVFDKSVLSMNEPVFIACLGVLVYLSKSAAGKIFRFAGSLSEKSEFVFTASQRADKKGLDSIAERAAQAGEAWISHFDPAELIKQLTEDGFSHVAYLSPEEATRLYFVHTGVVLPPPRGSSLVRAVI